MRIDHAHRFPSPDLYRWTRLAQGDRADFRRLLHRQMDRRERRRPFRRARSRNPNFKGPRTLDPAGMPTHADNQSIVKERIYFDKADPKLLHDEITLIDHAYTRPWTVVEDLPPRSGQVPGLVREYDCNRRQRADEDRQRNLFQGRRRQSHADAEGPAAARSEILPENGRSDDRRAGRRNASRAYADRDCIHQGGLLCSTDARSNSSC